MTVIVTTEQLNHGQYLRWHIRRPERMNAIGTSIAGELAEAMNLALTQPPPGVRALVITAETVVKKNQSIWIAGGDLRELAQLTTKGEGRAYAAMMHRLCRELELLPIPVIALMDGAAIGGGAELALAADIRLATERSSFEFKQLKMGLATGYGAASRLCDLIGKSRAQRLLYFCESVSATEALELGLIHRLIPNLDGLNPILTDLMNLEALAITAQKKMLHFATGQSSDATVADRIFEELWRNATHNSMLDQFLTRKE